MYCNNCGEKGHVFRDCIQPIMSCGLILLDSLKLPCDPKTVKVLLVRRKNSMAFTEFVRGIDDNIKNNNNIIVYSKDKLTSVIADISSILNDIDQSIIIK